jgi:hypothetical protein
MQICGGAEKMIRILIKLAKQKTGNKKRLKKKPTFPNVKKGKKEKKNIFVSWLDKKSF